MVVQDSPAVIQQGGVSIALEEVTPSVAEANLLLMPINRRIRPKNQRQITHAMETKQYIEYIYDPIRFNDRGEFIDGQHRMMAIISTGRTQTMLVIRGIPSAAMNAIDTGVSRGLSDLLYFNHESESGHLAAAINVFRIWQDSGEVDSQHDTRPMTHAEGEALLVAHPGLRDTLPLAKQLQSVLRGGVGRWAAIVYILERIHQEDALYFFDHLRSGAALGVDNPIFTLRRRLLENQVKKMKIPRREVGALVFKSWNMYRRGETSMALRVRLGGAAPENYPQPI